MTTQDAVLGLLESHRPNVNVLRLMEESGGGFAGALAAAWMKADDANGRRLAHAFSDLYEEYRNQYLTELNTRASAIVKKLSFTAAGIERVDLHIQLKTLVGRLQDEGLTHVLVGLEDLAVPLGVLEPGAAAGQELKEAL